MYEMGRWNEKSNNNKKKEKDSVLLFMPRV